MGSLYVKLGGGGGGGIDTSQLTATAADVMEGKIAAVAGSEEPVTGTLTIPAASVLAGHTINGVTGTATSDANAIATRVCNGYTVYVNGAKVTGTLTFNSIISW